MWQFKLKAALSGTKRYKLTCATLGRADTSPGSTDNLLVSPVLQKAYKKGMLYTEHSWADVAIKNAYVRSFKRYSVK